MVDFDGRVMFDSTSIIAELERLRPDPPLYPGDSAARARALALEDYRLPDPWPPGLVELRAGVAARPGFRWVLDIYARHRGPSFELASASHASELGATG